MAHASAIAAIGRHGPPCSSILKGIDQQNSYGSVYQHMRPVVPCSQNVGSSPGTRLLSGSAFSSGRVAQGSRSFRHTFLKPQKLSKCKGSSKSRIPLNQGTVRCHSSAVSAGGSEDLETSMEEMALRVAQQRQAQAGQWQGDRPMILPLLLREKKPEHFVK